MVYVAVAFAWLVVGAAVGVIDTRHGHWRHSWLVSAILGPFALALAWERRHLEEGYEVLVIGCRGKGLSKLVLGSCASTLAWKAKVPVMLVPAVPATPFTKHGDDMGSPAQRNGES